MEKRRGTEEIYHKGPETVEKQRGKIHLAAAFGKFDGGGGEKTGQWCGVVCSMCAVPKQFNHGIYIQAIGEMAFKVLRFM